MAIERARPDRAQTVGVLITVGSALMLALNDVIVPPLYGMGPNAQSVVALRYVFFIIAMVLVMAAFFGFRFPPGRLPHAVLAGALSSLGSLGLLAALSRMPIALALIIVYTYPIWTAVFASLYARQRPSLLVLFCLSAALGGIALSVGVRDVSVDPLGVAFAIAGAVAFALSIVWNGVALNDVDPMPTSVIMAFGGLVLSLALTTSTGGLLTPTSALGWGLLTASSVCFSLAFIGMVRGIQLIGATPTAMIMNLEVVFATGLAFVIFGQAVTPWQLVGSTIILAAVIVSQLAADRKRVHE